jgi:CP family cyanate transporter-like MFS transporter
VSAAPPPEPFYRRPLFAGRVLVLVAIVLAAANLRTAVTALSPLFQDVGSDLGFGATFIGLLGMLPTASFAIFGFATPFIARKIGLERLAFLSMFALALGQLLRGFTNTPAGLLAFSALALAGIGAGNVVLPPIVKRYFPERIGAISTLYVMVMQFGTFVPALIAVPLSQSAGWRFSLASWSALAFVAAAPWIGVLVQNARRAPEPAAAGPAPAAIVPEAARSGNAPEARGQVWRSPIALGLTAVFAATALNSYAMLAWLPTIVVSAGGSEGFGGAMVALFGILGLVPAIIMPSVATRVRNPFPIVAVCGVLFVAGYLGLLLFPLHGTVLWVSLIGLGPSCFALTLTLINVRSRTPLGSASLSGFMQGVGYGIGCLGPLLFGILYSATGGWALSFGFLGVTLVMLVVGGWYACRPLFVEDTWHRRAKG